MVIRLTRHRLVVILSVVLTLLAGCARERPSQEPPVHINPNMDLQPKYRPQAESRFFSDGATMRPLVPGTVARGELNADTAYYEGKNGRGEFIVGMPDSVMITTQLLERGQERFNIYCSPCHGRVGDGKGIMVNRGYVPPPTFHSDRIRQMPNGQIFDVITNGVRNMPAYRYQIPVDDRWAIISYIRALERSQNATIEDVPESMRERIQQESR
ncbi:MAG: cytochrome c [Candidatus Zixiibacteriota bacterium]